MHANGLYSAFGREDRDGGGTWLSAFVLTSLIDIKKNELIQIDDEKLMLTARSLIERQSNDGSFRQNGAKLFSKAMAGALMLENANQQQQQLFIGLTSYVAVALIKYNQLISSASSTSFDREIERSMKYLRRNLLGDIKKLNTFDLAMSFYAFSVYNEKNSSCELVKKIENELNERAVNESKKETIHWKLETNDESKSADLELTSYILLAKMLNKMNETRKLLPIVKWINEQRNSLGGFYSTQV